jgi:hypothetical protein
MSLPAAALKGIKHHHILLHILLREPLIGVHYRSEIRKILT